MTNPDHANRIALAIEKMPQWLRHDLNASEVTVRQRAQEALTAMIVAAIEGVR